MCLGGPKGSTVRSPTHRVQVGGVGSGPSKGRLSGPGVPSHGFGRVLSGTPVLYRSLPDTGAGRTRGEEVCLSVFLGVSPFRVAQVRGAVKPQGQDRRRALGSKSLSAYPLRSGPRVTEVLSSS